MASDVQICNLALTRLAASRITSLDQGTTEANDCNAIFSLVIEEVIGDGDWPSARTRASLAQSSETPAFGFAYMYQLPTYPKFIAPLEINNSRPGDVKFIIEGDKLLTDESTMDIRYSANITDTEKLDIYLRQAIVDRLVAELIYKQTSNRAAYRDALKYAEEHRKELLARANLHDNSKVINSDTFIDCRLTGDTWGDQE